MHSVAATERSVAQLRRYKSGGGKLSCLCVGSRYRQRIQISVLLLCCPQWKQKHKSRRIFTLCSVPGISKEACLSITSDTYSRQGWALAVSTLYELRLYCCGQNQSVYWPRSANCPPKVGQGGAAGGAAGGEENTKIRTWYVACTKIHVFSHFHRAQIFFVFLCLFLWSLLLGLACVVCCVIVPGTLVFHMLNTRISVFFLLISSSVSQ